MHIGQGATVTFYVRVEEKMWRKLRKQAQEACPQGWTLRGSPSRGYMRYRCYSVVDFGRIDKAFLEFWEAKYQLIADKNNPR